MDDMPAMLLDLALHRKQEAVNGLPNFHSLLEANLPASTTDSVTIKAALKKTYRDFFGITDEVAADPDVWKVASGWLETMESPEALP